MRYYNLSRDHLPNLPKIFLSDRVADARSYIFELLKKAYRFNDSSFRVEDAFWLLTDEHVESWIHNLFKGRCAYCERYAPLGVGRAHWHRPPSAAENLNRRSTLLAYSWLMFDPNNLLYVCARCDKLKGRLFPVSGKRAQPFVDHGNEYVLTKLEEVRLTERELFCDPTLRPPTRDLNFMMNGHVRGKTRAGQTTIDILRLDDEDLVEARHERILNIMRLLRRGEMPDFQSSGAKSGHGSQLPIMPPGLFSTNSSATHAGATALAICDFGERHNLPGNNARAVCKYISSAPRKERERLFDIAELEQIRGVRTENSINDLPPSTSKRSIPSVDRNLESNKRRLESYRHSNRVLSGFRISNFKALQSISVEIDVERTKTSAPPCVLLVGENATGKSSVLEALALALIGADAANALHGSRNTPLSNPADLIHRRDLQSDEIADPKLTVSLRFYGENSQTELNLSKFGDGFQGEPDPAQTIIAYGPRRFFSETRVKRDHTPQANVRSLFDPLDVIADPRPWLLEQSEDTFTPISRALREMLMLTSPNEWIERRSRDPKDRSAIVVHRDGEVIPLGDLSVGFKSILALACDVMRELQRSNDNFENASAIVLIDEIETHLHPRWKMRIVSLLRKVFPRVQFIITTHDPLCLQGAEDGEVFVMFREGKNKITPLTDLPSLKGMRVDQILTAEFFGLNTTDPRTDDQLIRFYELAARHDLNKKEKEELRELDKTLEDNMVIGDTLISQAESEALREIVSDQSDMLSLSDLSLQRRKVLENYFRDKFTLGSG